MELPCINRALSDDEYNYSDKYSQFWRATQLKDTANGYRHFARCMNNPTSYTDIQLANFEVGHYAEAHYCADHEKLKEYCFYNQANRPDKGKTMAASANKEWKTYLASRYGRKLINVEDIDFLHKAEFFKEELALLEKLKDKDSTRQISLFWQDQATGIKLKSRPDVVRESSGWIMDVKTTKAKTESDFKRDIHKLLYILQAQSQIDGCLKTGLLDKVNGYMWVGISKVHPYNVFFVEYGTKRIESDKEQYRSALAMAARYEKEGFNANFGDSLISEF